MRETGQDTGRAMAEALPLGGREVLQGALDWAADGSGNMPVGKPPVISMPRASAELLCFPRIRVKVAAICPWPAQVSLAQCTRGI